MQKKTFRLKDQTHPQAMQEFNDCKFFLNVLNEIIEIDPKYYHLAEQDWTLHNVADSDLFELASLKTVGYDVTGHAIVEWS